MLAFMGYAMLAAAVLGVAGWLIDFAIPRHLGRRRVLWAAVFLASAVGPIVFSVTRGVSTVSVAEQGVGAAAAGGKHVPIVSDRVLGSSWLAMSAVFAIWLVATQSRLQRRLRACPSRIVDGERVLVSSDFGPAVVGVVRPRIVLPEWVLATPERDRRIIVAHETEHRQAHDAMLGAMALVLVAVFPWNAALWWQLRRLRLAIEIDCDRRVVTRHSHDAQEYGMLLLATRERTSRVTPALAMAMAPMRSGLGRRIEALLGGRPRSAVRRLGAVGAAVVLATGFVSVPAPRISMGAAAVEDAPVIDATVIDTSVTNVSMRAASRATFTMPPLPPAASQASTRSPIVEKRLRTASAAPKRRIEPSATEPNRRIVPPTEASELRVVHLSGGATRAILQPGARSRVRMLRSGTAPDRVVLLPPRDAPGSPPL